MNGDKFEQEFEVTHEQFIEGMLETINIIKDVLETFKEAFRKTKDPFAKIEMEKYAESLVDTIRLFKSYTIRVENGIGVKPIVFFTDGKALFGYRMQGEVDFYKKWYEIITKIKNGKEMVS